MKRALLITVAAALASAVMLTAALAEGSMSDPAGDAGDAPDITGIQVSNDNGGTIWFRVAVSGLTPESILWLDLDTDKNSATGKVGTEYSLEWESSANPDDNGWYISRWDGNAWVDTDHSTVRGIKTEAGVEFSINKSDLGGTSGFALKAITARFAADAVTARDYAPDGLATWTYDLTAPKPTPTPTVVKPVFGTAATIPAKPVAGKKVVFTLAVKRSDTGAPLTTGKMICDPSYKGIVIKHVESFNGGTAKLVFTVPKAAKGKTVKVKVTILNGKQSATKVVTYKVV